MALLLLTCLLPIVFLFLVLLPFGFTAQALASLFVVPGQLARLFRDRTLRRNHALEHATVNVLEERYGPSRLGGLAQHEGFLIHGGANPEFVLDAAREGRRRLRAGERDLAIHSRCGTTLVAANLVSALTFVALLFYTGQFSFLNIVLALVAAWLLARPLSLVLQRYVTTDASIGDLEILGLEWEPPTSLLGLLFSGGLPQQIFVRTRAESRPTVTVLDPHGPTGRPRLPG